MLNRNEFLRSSVGLAAAWFGFAACGKDPSSGGDADGTMIDAGDDVDAAVKNDAGLTRDAATDSPAASCSMNGTSVAIGSNHGHTMTVSKAEVAAAVEKTYDIQGTSAHPHSVTVTAADFAKLANNMDVVVMSTTNSMHSHSVTVRCA